MGNVQEELDEIDATGTETVDPRVGIAAAVVLAALVAGLSFIIIRRRRERSLMRRLKDSIPEMDEVRATLKRPLRRAVKAL